MTTHTTLPTEAWRERFSDSMMRTFAPPLTMLVRGEGCRVWDADGVEYLDFLAGIAVNSLGHAHPALVEAVSRQVATLGHVSNYFATPSQVALAEKLLEITGAGAGGRVIYGNSGAEAIEAGLKLALLNRRGGEKPRILALQNAFHGRTTGAMALTGKPAQRAPFEPLIAGIEHLDSTLEALEEAMDDRVAALFLEPIKGEAGILPLPIEYLQRARELTTRHGALLIVDEIQTGIGRTGAWFAYQHAGIEPDAVAIAKGIGGGLPLGALVTFGATSELFSLGQHGSTYAGNPLVTAGALAVLGEIERAGLVENADRRGRELRELLLGLSSPLIAEVRGQGLLLGIGLTRPVATELMRACLAVGLIVNAANESSIRLAPPLTVGDAELADFRTRFATALETLA